MARFAAVIAFLLAVFTRFLPSAGVREASDEETSLSTIDATLDTNWFTDAVKDGLKDVLDNVTKDLTDLKDDIKDKVDESIANFASMIEKLKREALQEQDALEEKMKSLKAQITTAATDNWASLHAQLEEANAQLQEAKQKFADDLIAANVATAANIIRKEMHELQRKLKEANDGTKEVLQEQIKKNKERLQSMTDAATTKGVELAATIDQARVILTERIGELNVRAKTAKDDIQTKIEAEIVSLKTRLQELQDAAKTKVGGIRRGIQSTRDIIGSKIGYLAEKVKLAEGEAKAVINEQILGLKAEVLKINDRALDKLKDIKAAIETAKTDVKLQLGDKFDQMVVGLTELSASAVEIVQKTVTDQHDVLKNRIDTFQQGSAETKAALEERMELLSSIVADKFRSFAPKNGDASEKLDAAVARISESVGELQKKLKVALEGKKKELQAELDMLQEQGKELRDAADSIRDSAEAQAALIAQTISEKIGELRDELTDAQQETQAQIQSKIADLHKWRKDLMLKVSEKREDIRKSLQAGTNTAAETIGALKMKMATAAKEKKAEIEASIKSFKAQILSIRAELGGKLAEAEVKVSEVGELISESIGQLSKKLENAIAEAQGSVSEAIKTRIAALRGNVALLIERSLPNDELFADFKERTTKHIHDATESLKTATADKKKAAEDILQKLVSRLEQVTNTLSHKDVPDVSLLQKLESRLEQVTNTLSDEDVPDVFAAVMHADNIVEGSVKELENDEQKEALTAKQDEMWEALPYAATVAPNTPDDDGTTEPEPKSASVAIEPKCVLVALTVFSVLL